MDLTLNVGKVLGKGGSGNFLQVHDFTPEKDKYQKRGRLIALISFYRNLDEMDLVRLGREVLARIHEEYFGDMEKSVFNSLNDSVEKVRREFADEGTDVEIASCVFHKDVLYSSCTMGGSTFLLRNKALVPILQSNDTTISASGYPKAKDIFILTNKSFQKDVGMDSVKKELTEKNFTEAIELISVQAHSDTNPKSGCVLLEFSKEPGIEKLEEKKYDTTEENKAENKKIIKILDKLISFFPDRKLEIRKSEDTLDEKNNINKAFVIGIMLISLLSVSIFFGFRKKSQNDYRSSYETILLEAESLVNEAESIYELSPEHSRELFSQSKEKLAELENRQIKDERINQLRDKISESEQKILGIYQVEPQLFLDTTILRDGFVPNIIEASSDSIFVFDTNGGIGAYIKFDNKTTKLLSDKLSDVSGISVQNDNYYAMSSEGIYELGSSNKKVIEQDLSNAIFYSYAANLYIVSPPDSILRYSQNGEKFVSKEWLSEDTKSRVDLTNSNDMAIDGSIWVLVDGSTIRKMTQGVLQTFPIEEIEPGITHIDSIYTNENLEGIYLLDKGNSRIVKFDKNGVYKASYINDLIRDSKGFCVHQKNMTAVLLGNDGKLYSFSVE